MMNLVGDAQGVHGPMTPLFLCRLQLFHFVATSTQLLQLKMLRCSHHTVIYYEIIGKNDFRQNLKTKGVFTSIGTCRTDRFIDHRIVYSKMQAIDQLMLQLGHENGPCTEVTSIKRLAIRHIYTDGR